MIVVHIESGLGNQMLSYCEYMALRKVNSLVDCYIETITYDIPKCNEKICQWNGYELNKIFGINVPNLKSKFTKTEWNIILQEITNTQFWEKNWNYPVYFTKILSQHGLLLENKRGDFESKDYLSSGEGQTTWRTEFKNTRLGNFLYRIKTRKRINNNKTKNDSLFNKYNENIYTGQKLSFKKKGYGIEKNS